MKTTYSSLRCPHCGASEFNLIKDDIFLCEYCGEKFNIEIKESDFSEKNKILIDELKERFNQKIDNLKSKIRKEKLYLLNYKKLADSFLLQNISYIFLAISIILLFAAISNYKRLIPVAIFFIIVSMIFFIWIKILKRGRYKKYQPLILLCAANIVEYENTINAYYKLVSKLTKSV